jgi:hypothetical protein
MNKIERLIDIFKHPMVSTATEFHDGTTICNSASYTIPVDMIDEIIQALETQIAIERGEVYLARWVDNVGLELPKDKQCLRVESGGFFDCAFPDDIAVASPVTHYMTFNGSAEIPKPKESE